MTTECCTDCHLPLKLQYEYFWVLGVVLKTMVKYNGDYLGTAARKIHSDRSDKKITPEFVGEGPELNTETT